MLEALFHRELCVPTNAFHIMPSHFTVDVLTLDFTSILLDVLTLENMRNEDAHQVFDKNPQRCLRGEEFIGGLLSQMANEIYQKSNNNYNFAFNDMVYDIASKEPWHESLVGEITIVIVLKSQVNV
ncbi:hypothetical protein LXL04_022981 [Taraxacum kok-saghyz]